MPEYIQPARRTRITDRQKPDGAELEKLHQDIRHLEQFEADANTEFGKRLLKLLDESIDDTVKNFISSQLDTMDMNRAIFFLASVRSKLQTLMSLKVKYTQAKKEKEELIAELKRMLGESQ